MSFCNPRALLVSLLLCLSLIVTGCGSSGPQATATAPAQRAKTRQADQHQQLVNEYHVSHLQVGFYEFTLSYQCADGNNCTAVETPPPNFYAVLCASKQMLVRAITPLDGQDGGYAEDASPTDGAIITCGPATNTAESDLVRQVRAATQATATKIIATLSQS